MMTLASQKCKKCLIGLPYEDTLENGEVEYRCRNCGEDMTARSGRTSTPWSADEKRRALDLADRGVSVKEIALDLDRDYHAIGKIVAQERAKRRPQDQPPSGAGEPVDSGVLHHLLEASAACGLQLPDTRIARAISAFVAEVRGQDL